MCPEFTFATLSTPNFKKIGDIAIGIRSGFWVRSRFGNRSGFGPAIGPAGSSGPVRRPAGPERGRSGGPAGPHFWGSGRSLRLLTTQQLSFLHSYILCKIVVNDLLNNQNIINDIFEDKRGQRRENVKIRLEFFES